MSTSTGCHRTDDGWMLDSHLPTCRDRACTGCEPCTHDDQGNPVDHCTSRRHCTSHLPPGEHTCPRCVGKIRDNLDRILTDTAVAAAEAIVAGVDSEALNVAGPYANVILARWSRVNAVRAGDKDPDETDWHHPGIALGEWETTIREELGHTDQRLVSDTLTATVSYLSWVLTDLARNDDRKDLLVRFGGAVAELRGHLDTMLHDSHAREKGAPCFTCSAAAKQGVHVPRLVKQHSHWCTRDDCRREHDRTGARDRWVCEANDDHRFTEGEYRLQVERDRIRNADRLTASDMLERTGVPAGTIRRWAAHRRVRVDGEWLELDPQLRPVGKDDSKRLLYRVADVIALRDQAVDCDTQADTDGGA